MADTNKALSYVLGTSGNLPTIEASASTEDLEGAILSIDSGLGLLPNLITESGVNSFALAFIPDGITIDANAVADAVVAAGGK